MTDFLIMLLSTDWFLPYWTDLEIQIEETSRTGIQLGCREIVIQMLSGAEGYSVCDLSADRKRMTALLLIELLRGLNSETEFAETYEDWANLSHQRLTAVVHCARLNREILQLDPLVGEPQLDLSIRMEVITLWQVNPVNPSKFSDICLESKTDWDLYIQGLMSSPETLANQLWRVLLGRKLRRFWAHICRKLTPLEQHELVCWYRTKTVNELHEDRPDLIPSYMISHPRFEE
jgi:hypothetical protein